MTATCPCGAQIAYSDCCGRFIDAKEVVQTPEQLMRSRYTAYTQANIDYIVNTMLPPASDELEPVSAKEWAEQSEWLGLQIVTTKTEGDIGWVEFIAGFILEKEKHILHELSEFHKKDGVWYYVDGTTPEKKKPARTIHVGRNDPCTCGSGKKFKKCCG